jgi:hypothetical protein
MSVCETCGSDFEQKWPSRPGRFCSRRCYYESGVPRIYKERVKGPRMRSVPGHPIAPPSGYVAVARLALWEKIGSGPHRCHWCGTEVDWKRGLVAGALVADHLNWDIHDDRPENLVPSCNHCNHTRTRDNDRRRITEGEVTTTWGGFTTRAVERKCEFCGDTFLIPPAATTRGRGRFCSRSCARRAPRRKRKSA